MYAANLRRSCESYCMRRQDVLRVKMKVFSRGRELLGLGLLRVAAGISPRGVRVPVHTYAVSLPAIPQG